MLFIYQMRRFVLIFCLFLCGFQSNDDLAFSRQWLAIIHYQPRTFGAYQGTIKSPDFYLSKIGKTDPKAELEATISLFENDEQNEKKCLFPARYLFLKQNGLVKAPFPKCEEYAQFQKDLSPSGVTLLFTDAYMNNSSSLFGHTLIRIDTSRKGTQLLAHGVNYGAYTRGFEDSPFYAIYGLLGFFQGGITTKPYYDIINTYNNIENRDIWEYHLDFNQDELDLFVAHIWEIGHITTPYYFFSQNCSYMLLEILDAVKPDLRLAQDFKTYVIPLDTIKAVNQRGIVKDTTYRPSRMNKIKHRLKQMNKPQYYAFLSLIKDDSSPLEALEKDKQADVLETAYQYVQYQYIKKDLDLKEYRKKSFFILRKRNQMNAGQTFDELHEGQNPVFSHESGKIAFGFGFENAEAFQEFQIRPAYHSLSDNPKGYLKGAAINFLETRIRHLDNKDRYVLQDLKVLELVSLSPIDKTFHAPSYRINVDVPRIQNLYTKKYGHIGRTELALGGTYAFSDNFFAYALSSLDGGYGGFLRHNAYAGISAIGGLLLSTNKLSFQAEVKQTLASEKIGTAFESRVTSSYHIKRNIDLQAHLKYRSNGPRHHHEAGLFLKYFL